MIHGHFVTVQRQCYGPTYQLTGVGSTDLQYGLNWSISHFTLQ